jgi:hypothetical protein
MWQLEDCLFESTRFAPPAAGRWPEHVAGFPRASLFDVRWSVHRARSLPFPTASESFNTGTAGREGITEKMFRGTRLMQAAYHWPALMERSCGCPLFVNRLQPLAGAAV